MYKSVIFDLDGTLLDTLTDLANSVNFALEQLNFPTRSTQEVRKFIGNGVVVLMKRAVPENTSEEVGKMALEIFTKKYLESMSDNTCAYENVLDMLQKCKHLGVGTSVVSNKLHQAVVELCDEYFDGLIDFPFGVASESERKPSAKNVFKAIELLKTSSDDTIFVGDSEVDVQTAHNAGLKCIGVTWGFRDEAELINAGAEFIAKNCEEVLQILKA